MRRAIGAYMGDKHKRQLWDASFTWLVVLVLPILALLIFLLLAVLTNLIQLSPHLSRPAVCSSRAASASAEL
jgi:hypothetical protein